MWVTRGRPKKEQPLSGPVETPKQLKLIDSASTPTKASTLSTLPWASPARSSSPGGLREPPGPSPSTAPAISTTAAANYTWVPIRPLCVLMIYGGPEFDDDHTAKIRAKGIWPPIKIIFVFLPYPGPTRDDCKDDPRGHHRYKEQQPAQLPGSLGNKKHSKRNLPNECLVTAVQRLVLLIPAGKLQPSV